MGKCSCGLVGLVDSLSAVEFDKDGWNIRHTANSCSWIAKAGGAFFSNSNVPCQFGQPIRSAQTVVSACDDLHRCHCGNSWHRTVCGHRTLNIGAGCDCSWDGYGWSRGPSTSKPQPPKPKPLVYIAAPYTKGDQVANCRVAMQMWEGLRHAGRVTPICPHWSAYQQLLTPLEHHEWLAYDFELISRCDALLRLPGESKGADQEVIHARFKNIPVFNSVGELYKWVEGR